MVSYHVKMGAKPRVILFGGQGSSSLFSASALSAAKEDAQTSSAGLALVSRCHAALVEEYQSLDWQTKDRLGIDISKLSGPQDLLAPDTSLRGHSLIQLVVITLLQLLRYVGETEGCEHGFNVWSEEAIEVTGFCSGLLSASVVASSPSLTDFTAFSVEAFRLAFWIGCRSFLKSQELDPIHRQGASWSLVVIGLSLTAVQDQLREYHTRSNNQYLRISAISSATVISLTGPELQLEEFRQELLSAPVTKFADVHAWYHGGEHLESTLNEVMRDVKRRNVRFPGFKDLKMPVRSSSDGLIVSEETSESSSYTTLVVRHLLIHPVDWVKTSNGISSAVQNSLEQTRGQPVEIVSFGPSSDSLFAELKNRNRGAAVTFTDRSAFKSKEATAIQASDIAIVGMGVNFPKGNGQAQLWEILSTGLNAVSEIPGSRFDVSQYYEPAGDGKPRTMALNKGAFLDDIWSFDASFFNVSPREARSMDPQQRIILSTTQAALEDAGYVADATPSFQRRSIGCYIGLATGDYTDNLKDNIDVYYSPGTLRAFHSGKVSYVYKFSGPSMTIDTACSSSAVAIYQACRALQTGDCTTAIAGGANVISSPDMYLGLDRGHFLSHTNGCKPFDKDADGYGRAEGCGVFVLKRLSDAIAESDRIHGVIRGIEVNQSGNAHSITHPHSKTQTKLIRHLLSKNSIDPKSVDVVEAHGTGTQAGDTREISTLRAVFEKAHSAANPLIVSSVKGNTGHCEAASGSAGLAKLLLMLRKSEIPMQAGLQTLNPQLGDLENGSIIIPRRSILWAPRVSHPRRALLNNFGAAGSNVALVLEERIEPKIINAGTKERATYLFNLSARTEKALAASVLQHQKFLESDSAASRIKDICYTATARRQLYDHRISIRCSTSEDLQTELAKANLTESKFINKRGPIVFAFSGQGSLYHGMGRDLLQTSSFFKASIIKCDTILEKLGFKSVVDYISGELVPQSPSTVDDVVVSQCACFILEYSLAQLLMSWNIIPDYVLGHSLGEYAALVISGAVALEDALPLVANRARLMVELCPYKTSSMLACKLSASEVDTMIDRDVQFSRLNVACRNSKDACVIAGVLPQLDTFQKLCWSLGIKTKRLDVPYGFHSEAMDPILRPLKELSKSVLWCTPSIPVASNALGRFLVPDDFGPDYFARHARQPVRFTDIAQSLQKMRALDDAVCIEVGPRPITLPMIQDVADTTCHFFPSMQKDKDSWTMLYSILTHLFMHRDIVDWRRIFEPNMRILDLPGHPLFNTPFVVPYEEPSYAALGSEQDSPSYTDTGFSLLPRRLGSDSTAENTSFVFETTMAILGPHIAGHNVGGNAICPASVFFELALEAAHAIVPDKGVSLLIGRDISFSNPLIYDPENKNQLIRVHLVRLSTKPGTALDLKVTISTIQGEKEIQCCSTNLFSKGSNEVRRSLLKDAALANRQGRYFKNGNVAHNTFHKKLLYETIFTRVVAYSAEYQSLTRFSLSDSMDEGFGLFRLPSTSQTNGCLIPPVFTDTLLHAAGFAANLSVASDEICICGHVGSMEVLDSINFSGEFTVYCTLFDNSNGVIIADAIALNPNEEACAVIRGIEFKKLRLASFQRLLLNATTRPAKIKQSPERVSYPSSESEFKRQGLVTASVVPLPLAVHTRARVRDSVNNIVGEIYGSQDIDPMQSLEELGIDSLMQIEITSKLREFFPETNMSPNDLLQCESLEALENFVASAIPTPALTISGSATPEIIPSTPELVDSTSARVRDTMIAVIGEVYGSQDLDYSKSLDSLGIDSLMQIEIATKLKDAFPGTDFDHHDLLQHETLEGVEELLEHRLQLKQKHGTPRASFSPEKVSLSTDAEIMQTSISQTIVKSPKKNPSLLHPSSNTNPPLYLIHDGSGQVNMYKKVLQPDRQVFGFFDPNFPRKSMEMASLEQMAAGYASCLSTSGAHDLIIGGWSFGGVVAFQTALYLSKAGFGVKGLILIDSPYPRNHEALPERVVAHVINTLSSNAKTGMTDVVTEFKQNADLLADFNPKDFDASKDTKIQTVYLRSQGTLDTETACGVRYPWLSSQVARDSAIRGWEGLVGAPVKVLPIPGNHFEPFLPQNIASTSEQLRVACRLLDADE